MLDDAWTFLSLFAFWFACAVKPFKCPWFPSSPSPNVKTGKRPLLKRMTAWWDQTVACQRGSVPSCHNNDLKLNHTESSYSNGTVARRLLIPHHQACSELVDSSSQPPLLAKDTHITDLWNVVIIKRFKCLHSLCWAVVFQYYYAFTINIIMIMICILYR